MRVSRKNACTCTIVHEKQRRRYDSRETSVASRREAERRRRDRDTRSSTSIRAVRVFSYLSAISINERASELPSVLRVLRSFAEVAVLKVER